MIKRGTEGLRRGGSKGSLKGVPVQERPQWLPAKGGKKKHRESEMDPSSKKRRKWEKRKKGKTLLWYSVGAVKPLHVLVEKV